MFNSAAAMNLDDVPVGGGRSAFAAQPAVEVSVSQPRRSSRPIEKRPFLRRGEGVERRVLVHKYRKPSASATTLAADDAGNEHGARPFPVSKPNRPAAPAGSPTKRAGSAYASPRKVTPCKAPADQQVARQPARRGDAYAAHPSTGDCDRASRDTDGAKLSYDDEEYDVAAAGANPGVASALRGHPSLRAWLEHSALPLCRRLAAPQEQRHGGHGAAARPRPVCAQQPAVAAAPGAAAPLPCSCCW